MKLLLYLSMARAQTSQMCYATISICAGNKTNGTKLPSVPSTADTVSRCSTTNMLKVFQPRRRFYSASTTESQRELHEWNALKVDETRYVNLLSIVLRSVRNSLPSHRFSIDS